jgi:arabinofuranan 3-O-arabinosyltransferase
MTPSVRSSRRRLRLFVIFTVVLVLAYGRQLVASPTAGQDFRAFFAAGTVAARGGDPYDWPALARTEDALYNTPSATKPGDPRYYDFIPFPEGPWLAIALEPFTALTWQLVYVVYATLIWLAIVFGTWLILTRLGWAGRRRWLALACTALSPIAFFNVFQGQVSALIFLGFAAGWALAARGRPVLAGLALTLVWIKPNFGVVLPIVVVLLEPRSVRRTLLSFAGFSALGMILASAAIPGVLVHWVEEVVTQWRALQGTQPDVASLHSFYYPALSGWVKTLALAFVMVAGCGYAIWAFGRRHTHQSRALTLLLLWFALLPYVHSFDAILLIPVVAYLIRPDLSGWTHPAVEIALWGFATVPFGYFVGLRLGFFNGFTAVPVALLVIAWHSRLLGRPQETDMEAIAA